MSIMRDIFILKSGDSYQIYDNFGRFIFPYELARAAKTRNKPLFEFMLGLFEGYVSTLILNESEVLNLADADHSIDDGKPGYHRLAGDSVYLVDKDKKKVYYRTRERRIPRAEGESYFLPGSWKEIENED